jgi:translation initiation factor 3 subunit L
MNEIKQQSLLPIMRSYLKLYTTIGIDKLANLLERKADEETLTKILLCYNHKTRGLAWASGGAAISGQMATYSDISFYVENVRSLLSFLSRMYTDYFRNRVL